MKKGLWNQLNGFFKTYTSLTIIVAAALLLEVATGVMYYTAHRSLQETMERLMEREMAAIYLSIRNKLAKIEVTMDNTAWVVQGNLEKSEWVTGISPLLLKNNPAITSAGICFIPYYYPERGRWFEPAAIRKADGSMEVRQMGSASHDYTQSEFYTQVMTTDKSLWSEPYIDKVASGKKVTTYSVPVKTLEGKTVAVVIADISLDLLKDIMNEDRVYKSTQRILITGRNHLLVGEDTPVFQKALKLMLADKDHDGYFTMDNEEGQKQHVFYTSIGGQTDWVMINILDDAEVFDNLRRTSLFLLLPIMIGLLFVGFIVWRSSRNLERLRQANAEKDRIHGELSVASNIQQSMLPDAHLSQDDLDIAGSLMPAREVGGDIYDYFIRDKKLFFCIGDVSGKGAASAMLMAVCHALFRSSAAHESNPARIMNAINEAICQGNKSNMFITMFIGVLDLPTGRLRYCDAGHDAPFVHQHSSSTSQFSPLEVKPHLPIGVFDDTAYSVQEKLIEPDSTIFLYTDGLTEAKDKTHRQFGLERLQAVLRTYTDKTPKELMAEVFHAVSRFVKDGKQSDDLTMLVIRYTPRQFESVLTETFVIKNDLHEVTRFSSFIKSALGKLDIEQAQARQLRLAVEEAVVNVIDYAYPAGIKGDITISMMSDGRVLHFQIVDKGVPFDPTEKEKADTTLSAEDRQIGGLGILLVRELMDSINYEREDGKNVLTLIKKVKK